MFVIIHFSFTSVSYCNKQNLTVLQERKACMRFLYSTIARKTSIKHGLRRKDYCFYYWPLCQLWSAIPGLIRECCLCRLRSCGGCSHRPHIQLPQHACSACWVPCNAWEKQPFEKTILREEKVTSNDWEIRSGTFGVGGWTPLSHQVQSPQQRYHRGFAAQTFLNLILSCFHCRQDQQGKPSTQTFIQSKMPSLHNLLSMY